MPVPSCASVKDPPRVDFGRVMNFELTIECMSRPYEYLDKVASLGSLWRVVCLYAARPLHKVRSAVACIHSIL